MCTKRDRYTIYRVDTQHDDDAIYPATADCLQRSLESSRHSTCDPWMPATDYQRRTARALKATLLYIYRVCGGGDTNECWAIGDRLRDV